MKPRINLHGDEKMLFECCPDKKLIVYLYLIRGHFFIILPLFLYLFYNTIGLSGFSELSSLIYYFLVAIVTLNITAYAWLTFVMNKHWYFFTNTRCIVYSGYWGINKKIIPYNRIVDINMNRNPLRAMLGIAAIYITQQGVASQYTRGFGSKTEGISANMAIIDGLTPKMANQISDLMSQEMSNTK